MAQIIKGDDLMVFDNQGKSYAFATSHQLNLSGQTTDTTSKDHGIWGSTEISKINWEITSENLYTSDAYDKLVESMMSREPVKLYFGLKSQTDPDKTVADGDYTNWTTTAGYSGNAFITSLTANANTGENATYSVTFSGTGKLVKDSSVSAS